MIVAPHRRVTGREGRRPRRRPRPGRGRRLPRRPDRGRCPRPDPRPQGVGRDPLAAARRRRADLAIEITRDVIQQEEVISKDLADGTVGYVKLNGFSDRGADEVKAALKAHVDAGRDADHPGPARQSGGLRDGGPRRGQPVHRIGHALLGAGGRRDADPDRRGGRRGRHRPGDPGDLPRRWRKRIGQRDRRGGPAGQRAGDARRPDDVRQGDRPAVAGAHRRRWRVPPDHRPLAHPGQALDPRRGHRTRCRRRRSRRMSRPATTRSWIAPWSCSTRARSWGEASGSRPDPDPAGACPRPPRTASRTSCARSPPSHTVARNERR